MRDEWEKWNMCPKECSTLKNIENWIVHLKICSSKEKYGWNPVIFAGDKTIDVQNERALF